MASRKRTSSAAWRSPAAMNRRAARRSLSPTAVGPVKAMLLELNAGKAATLIAPLIDSPAGSVPIRERLKAFAAEQGLQL